MLCVYVCLIYSISQSHNDFVSDDLFHQNATKLFYSETQSYIHIMRKIPELQIEIIYLRILRKTS